MTSCSPVHAVGTLSRPSNPGLGKPSLVPQVKDGGWRSATNIKYYCRQAPLIGKYITVFDDVLHTFTKVLGKLYKYKIN